jgi:hypothetical protein
MSNRLNQPDLPRSPKTVACVTVTFWLVAFLGNLQSSVLQPSCPIASSAREALQSVALAAVSQALQACLFGSQPLAQTLVHMFLSLWLLLFAAVAALLLRGGIRR